MSFDSKKWREEENKKYEALKLTLRDKHLRLQPERIHVPVFEQAWEYGHSAGESEVENYYIDLARLVKIALVDED